MQIRRYVDTQARRYVGLSCLLMIGFLSPCFQRKIEAIREQECYKGFICHTRPVRLCSFLLYRFKYFLFQITHGYSWLPGIQCTEFRVIDFQNNLDILDWYTRRLLNYPMYIRYMGHACISRGNRSGFLGASMRFVFLFQAALRPKTSPASYCYNKKTSAARETPVPSTETDQLDRLIK